MEADSGRKLAERSNAGLIVVTALSSFFSDNSHSFVWPVLDSAAGPLEAVLQPNLHRNLFTIAAQSEPNALVNSVANAP